MEVQEQVNGSAGAPLALQTEDADVLAFLSEPLIERQFDNGPGRALTGWLSPDAMDPTFLGQQGAMEREVSALDVDAPDFNDRVAKLNDGLTSMVCQVWKEWALPGRSREAVKAETVSRIAFMTRLRMLQWAVGEILPKGAGATAS